MTNEFTLNQIQERLIERTMAPYPLGAPIVTKSTPVVSFGNPISAEVVTLGINPSYEEFQNSRRHILKDGEKRLVDHEILGGDFQAGLNSVQAKKVLEGCYQYFKNNPYKWFAEIEKTALAPLGFSYHDGSAAHLDIIQWATDPVWSKIEDISILRDLLWDDAQFLRFQLKAYDFKYVLMNGKTVIEQVQSLDLVKLSVVDTISFGNGTSRSKLWRGQSGDKTFLGWNLNIQRHETTASNRAELTSWLRSEITAGALN